MIDPWHLMTNDGTYSFNPERKVPTSGYVVAIKGKGIELSITDKDTHRVSNWLQSVMWSVSMSPDRFVGSWFDTETYVRYLDVVRIIVDRAEAIDYARSQNEIAIWDIQNEQEIRV